MRARLARLEFRRRHALRARPTMKFPALRMEGAFRRKRHLRVLRRHRLIPPALVRDRRQRLFRMARFAVAMGVVTNCITNRRRCNRKRHARFLVSLEHRLRDNERAHRGIERHLVGQRAVRLREFAPNMRQHRRREIAVHRRIGRPNAVLLRGEQTKLVAFRLIERHRDATRWHGRAGPRGEHPYHQQKPNLTHGHSSAKAAPRRQVPPTNRPSARARE